MLLRGLLALGLLVSGEGFSIPDTGYWWQGRYVMSAVRGAIQELPF